MGNMQENLEFKTPLEIIRLFHSLAADVGEEKCVRAFYSLGYKSLLDFKSEEEAYDVLVQLTEVVKT